MQNQIKQRIHELVESIDDQEKLQMLMEDVEVYINKTSEDDDLTDSEMVEIDETLSEMERGEFISWNDLQKTMKEWREK